VTDITLPRYFLQDLEVIKHPETDEPWWVPGSLATTFHSTKRDPEGELYRPKRSPLAAYVLNKKVIIDKLSLSGPGSATANKYRHKLIGRRTGMANEIITTKQTPQWRSDMGDFVLERMRAALTAELIRRSTNQPRGLQDRFIEPVDSLEDVKHVVSRGCVLWLPDPESGKGVKEPHATMDIEGVSYDGKIPVHDLNFLLGPKHVAALREEPWTFKPGHEVYVVRPWPSPLANRLHLLLWRLQGYLADTLREEANFTELEAKDAAEEAGEAAEHDEGAEDEYLDEAEEDVYTGAKRQEKSEEKRPPKRRYSRK
jgi:hypothetical protein